MNIGNFKLTVPVLIGIAVVVLVVAAFAGNRAAKKGEKTLEHILVAEATLAIGLVVLYWLLHFLANSTPAPVSTAASAVGKAASW